MVHTTRYRVVGSGQFPLDMLRYDRSYPEREAEIWALGPFEHDEARTRELRTVTLVHIDGFSKWHPTAARWKSFGWTVETELP